MFQKITLNAIALYQRTISPDHGLLKHHWPAGYCKYSPSCSQYCYQVIEKHGVIKGGAMAIWRLARCNPWSQGGRDPIP
ncbi:membrane protein insertion efficiency factor YidD [Candidatus Berkelbacteria bacterium]|nr:membrane protein insertion efficiency factor YidD [Candidatus Berkelbacteria bacterium]